MSSSSAATRTPVGVVAVAVIAAVAVALLGAACGGSPGSHVAQVGSIATESSTSSNGETAPAQASGAVAFARCMRSHGVPNWPDPLSSGGFDKSELTPQRLGAGSSEVQAAQSACSHLLPGGNAPSPARVQQLKALSLSFSRCVRSHGVPNFPDPASDGRIPDPATVGINQGSPKFEAANQACAKYRPPYMPSNATYNAYARTHG